MLSKIEQAKVLTMLTKCAMNFPAANVSKETLAGYTDYFDRMGYSIEQLEPALMKILATSKYFPSIAEIIEMIDTLPGPSGIFSADDAWAEVQEQVRMCYPYKAPTFSNPNVKKAVGYIGWQTICEANIEYLDSVRLHFIQVYNSILKRKKDEIDWDRVFKAVGYEDVGQIIHQTANRLSLE